MPKILTPAEKRVLIHCLLSQNASARRMAERRDEKRLPWTKASDWRPESYCFTRREILNFSRHLDTVKPLSISPLGEWYERLLIAVNGAYVQPSIYDGKAGDYGRFMCALAKLGLSVTHK